MPRGVSQLEWTTPDEEDEGPLLAEDYVWLMRHGLDRYPEQIPDLQWVWDLGARDLLRFRLSVATRQPIGSA